jgi:Cys-tRNA(Pro)/Cys-tRNA(Cys) deacylase
MVQKTQAMRILEGQGIAYSVYSYDRRERDATVIAGQIGFPPQEVFKTLVIVRPDNKPLLVMVPADRQLSLKELARHIGEKKVKMASHAEAERLTGLQVGGISAVALLNRGFSMILDDSALGLESIVISAGQKGLQIRLGVEDLLQITNAEVLEIAA